MGEQEERQRNPTQPALLSLHDFVPPSFPECMQMHISGLVYVYNWSPLPPGHPGSGLHYPQAVSLCCWLLCTSFLVQAPPCMNTPFQE